MLRVFYARRFLRILPIYIPTILVVYSLPQGHPSGALPHYLTFTQEIPSYWGGEWHRWLIVGHTWTLAVEEQFYLFWPLLLLATPRWLRPGLCLAMAGIAVSARLAGASAYLLLSRADGLAAGSLLAILSAGSPRPARILSGIGFAGAAILLLPILRGPNPWMHARDYGMSGEASFATLASLGIVAGLASGRAWWTGWLGHPALAYLGKISYGMYLYHLPLLFYSHIWSTRLGVQGTWMEAPLYLASVVLTAALSWHCYEWPILRLKDRFPYGERVSRRTAQEEIRHLEVQRR